jgi:hypothetical protein
MACCAVREGGVVLRVRCSLGCASLPETGAGVGSVAAATFDASVSATEAIVVGSRATCAGAKGASVRSIAGASRVIGLGSDRRAFGAALADSPRVTWIPAATQMAAARMRAAATYGTRGRRRAGAPGLGDFSTSDETSADAATARCRVVCAARSPVWGRRAVSGVGGLKSSTPETTGLARGRGTAPTARIARACDEGGVPAGLGAGGDVTAFGGLGAVTTVDASGMASRAVAGATSLGGAWGGGLPSATAARTAAWTLMRCPHLRHFIRTFSPTTLSSAIWYAVLHWSQRNFTCGSRAQNVSREADADANELHRSNVQPARSPPAQGAQELVSTEGLREKLCPVRRDGF